MFQGVAWTICNSSGKIFVGIDYPGDRFRATRIRPISRRAQRPGSVVSPEVRFPPFSFFRRSGRGGRTSGCRLRTGAGGPVRPFGAILPTSLRLWAPSAHEAADGHAVRRPLPLRLLCPPCAALPAPMSLRVLPLFLASQKWGSMAHFSGVFVPCVPSSGTQSTQTLVN